MRPKNTVFRKACHCYRKQRELYSDLIVNNRYLFDERTLQNDEGTPEKRDALKAEMAMAAIEAELLKKNIDLVEHTFEKIGYVIDADTEMLGGPEMKEKIRKLIWDNYVEGICVRGLEESGIKEKKIHELISRYLDRSGAKDIAEAS